MSDQKISALTSYTPPGTADVLPIVDTANTTTKKITIANLTAYIAALAENLTNKTITSPTLVTPALGTPTSGVLTSCTGTASGLTAGKATNIVGGLGGSLPYQSAVDTTALLANGTSGQFLQSNGTTLAPSWSSAVIPAGVITPYAGSSAPTGYLLCDGAAVSRSTYAALFAVVSTTYGAGDGSTTFNVPNLKSRGIIGAGTGTKVATFSSRASNVITVTGLTNANDNEFQTGQQVTYHTSTSVMTGLTNDTAYYLIKLTNATFSLATTLANAQAGTAISLSSDGSGTQTFTFTFTARTLADAGGEETHAMSSVELLAHTHIVQNNNSNTSNGNPIGGAGAAINNSTNSTNSTGGNSAMNVMNPYLVLNYIIKT